MSSPLGRLLSDPNRTQRQKLELLRTTWRGELEGLDDARLHEALRVIRKALNSKKLRTQVDELIGALRRDGAEGKAPLPKREQAPAPVVAAADPKPPDADRNPELEARLAADPRDRASCLVYRDWLEGRGFVEDGRVMLGPLADCEDMLDELEWRDGFIRAARVRYTSERFNGQRPEVSVEQALEWLLDNPGPGRLIERLTIGLVRHDDNEYAGVCRVIGARLRPALTELTLGDFEREECELNWASISDASPLWAAVPRLRKLYLRAGSMGIEGIDLPQLRELETETGGMPPQALAAIAHADWPKLERLSLQIGCGSQGAATEVALVEPLLAGAKLPALRHLGLCNCEFTDELCERLASAAILPQLRSLDLSMGTMTLAGVQALLRTPGAFAHLERIDVEDNYLPDEAAQALAGLGPTINFGMQRDDEGGGLYASAYE
ncbi:MAG: hypothetical protein R6X02_03895 [Enhygromyxa sp.]